MLFDVAHDVPQWEATASGYVRKALDELTADDVAYVRVEVPFTDIDPFEFLGCDGDPTFAWADGTRNLTFVAGDPVATVEPLPSASLEVQCALLAERIEGDTDGPLFVGGCAFSNTVRWPEWPVARFFLPRWHVVREKDGVTRCFVCTKVTFGEAVRTVLGRLASAVPTSAMQMSSSAYRGEVECSPVESRQSWMSRVERAAQAVCDGELAKVVLAREVSISPPHGTEFSAVDTLRCLRNEHPGSITFAMHVPGRGTFLGATPETLVEVAGMDVSTHALAGTIRRGATDAEDDQLAQTLFESTKDRQEHRVVVDAMVDTLRPMCRELTVSDVPRPIRLAQMQHLATPILGTLTYPTNVLSLARELHPTPAVGGWPRAKAAQYLDRHEPTRRGWYAAPIGWIDAHSDGVFGVAIRSALVTRDRARAWVGAGIVGASDPEKEWRETDLKLKTIVNGLVMSPTESTGEPS